MTKKINNAIIIHGPGKSGTTLLNDILSLHKDLYWISSYLNKHPDKTFLAFLNNIKKIGFLEEWTRNKNKYPRPVESFHFWSYYIHNFHKNTDQFDTREIKSAIRAARRIGKYQTGNRLIIKLTGPARLEFINAIFEDPYVIWIDRDPRAIIASFFKNKWRYKDRKQEFLRRSKSELIEEYVNYYNWITNEKECLKKFHFKIVRYEDLTENPNQFFAEVCSFLNLKNDKHFKNLVNNWKIKKDANDQFRKQFDKEELNFLEQKLNPINAPWA